MISFLALCLALVPPVAGSSAQADAIRAPILWGAAVLRQTPEWYASAEARALANSVLEYQSAHGAWPKNTDMTRPPAGPEVLARILKDGLNDTIDNGATTMPVRFLALVGEATGETGYRRAAERGIDYLLAAQYPNGGWPQFFPLREGYYSHVTYNDNAMVNVLTLLREVGAGVPPYAFVSPARKAKASAAVSRGIELVLRSQIRQEGKLTAWCAQYDENTLTPAWARKYEPPSLSGNESVFLVRFLMEIDQPTPEIVAAVEAAVAWLRAVAISGVRYEDVTFKDGRKDRRLTADPQAAALWARFYELGTNRPIFLGRDSVVHYAVSEIEYERRNGYAYYGDWPASLLEKDYPRWRERRRSPQPRQ